MADRDALQTELANLEHRAKTEPHNADRVKARIHDVKAALRDAGPADAEPEPEAAVDAHADAEHAVERKPRGR